MEQIHHMSLSGHAGTIPLTATAHARLLHYLSETRAALTSDPDADETVRDLETTLGERLHAIAAATGQAVDDPALAHLLSETGTIERGTAAPPPPRVVTTPARGRFLCRINEGKWFGGLCAGIAARSDFNVDWTRTVMFFLLLLTGGTIGLVYLVVLLLVPRVETLEEYHRLCAEPRPAS
ncbi:PspC domain-containing protein [Plantibacter flavus]|uniref:PspC domain-containing protein n=1 Tax=Plantibacter flavus TaxID=150123 RepID=UPI003F191DD9